MCVHVCRCICACVCTQTHILHTGVTILVLSVATNVLNEHELEQTLKESEGQGSLACCSPWFANNLTRLSD